MSCLAKWSGAHSCPAAGTIFLSYSDFHHLKREIMLANQFQECIDACMACAVACSNCAIACLEEENVGELRQCIRLDLECAAVCRAAAEVMSMQGTSSAHLCRVCADICSACADECSKHAEMGMDHCRECAEACRKCAEACESMATAV